MKSGSETGMTWFFKMDMWLVIYTYRCMVVVVDDIVIYIYIYNDSMYIYIWYIK